MSDSNANDNSSAEKREYFRVNHDVLFEYKVVDSYTAEEQEPSVAAEESLGASMAGDLQKIDRDLQQSIQTLSRRDAALANTLAKLNKKVDKILQYSVLNSDEQNRQKTRINLSEGGIAFRSSRAVYKGNYLLLRLVFLPGYLPVLLFAKVVRCETNNDEHHVAARFHRASDETQKELARQIMKAQASNRRRETAKKP